MFHRAFPIVSASSLKYEPRCEKTSICICETKTQISFAVQPALCQTRSETPKPVFSQRGSYVLNIAGKSVDFQVLVQSGSFKKKF